MAEMTRTEAKQKAKEVIAEAIGTAYYHISEGMDGFGMTDGEKDLVIEYINKFGATACKSIGQKYITY